jgi:hypothetical protein
LLLLTTRESYLQTQLAGWAEARQRHAHYLSNRDTMGTLRFAHPTN